MVAFKKIYTLNEALKVMKDKGVAFTRLAWKRQVINKIILLLNGSDIAINLLNEYSSYALPENSYNGLLLIDNTNNRYIFGWSPNIYDIISDDWIQVYDNEI